MSDAHMGGFIEKMLPEHAPSYGFIRGDDGRQYFFIPSGLARLSTVVFANLQPSARVTFEPFVHPSKGMRAREVRIESHGHAG